MAGLAANPSTQAAPSGSITVADYFALDDDFGNQRHELWDGRLEVAPSPSERHQDLVLELAVVLRKHVLAQALGKVVIGSFDVIVGPKTVLQPDLLYFAAATKPVTLHGKPNYRAPTLVVEVVSPGGRRRDRVDKLTLYEAAGIPHYWIVDLASQSIEAYTLLSGAYADVIQASATTFSAPPFPDLAINVADLFTSPFAD